MSDTIGRLLVSGDYRGNLEKIAEELNKFDASPERGEFVVHGKKIYFNRTMTYYPTVDFGRWYFEVADGRKMYLDEMTKSQVDKVHCSGDVIDEGQEDVTLESISARIAPHLTQGKLTITAIGFDTKHQDGYLNSLTVNCDGSIDRVRHCVDEEQCAIGETERFRVTQRDSCASEAVQSAVQATRTA